VLVWKAERAVEPERAAGVEPVQAGSVAGAEPLPAVLVAPEASAATVEPVQVGAAFEARLRGFLCRAALAWVALADSLAAVTDVLGHREEMQQNFH